ncbi:MAG: hypothetical protein H7Y09_00085 [Chitinophagaceae bacterium]|nr:hypothetical protein [Anaerolineae bacterium]
MTFDEIVQEIQTLPINQRKSLIKLLVDTLPDEESVKDKKHSLLELEGLGTELWHEIDAQAYVNQLRQEWDHRP